MQFPQKFYSDKRSVLLPFLGSLAFSAMTLYPFVGFISNPGALLDLAYSLIFPSSVKGFLYTIIFIVVGGVFVFFFPVGTVILAWPLFRLTPMVIVDETGFTDKSSLICPGYVPWEDVKSLGSLKIDKELSEILPSVEIDASFLTIRLKNPKKYLKKMNPIKRALLNMNRRNYSGDVFISTEFIAGSPEDLAQAFCEAALAWSDKNRPE